jgi:thiamine biosynthesis protein ThiI
VEALVAHYAEIGLKGRNRGFFEETLSRNITRALRGTGYRKIRTGFGRIVVDFEPEPRLDEAARRAARMFGVAYVGAGRRVDPTMESLGRNALELLGEAPFESFRIKTRKSYADFDDSSQEVNETVGALVKDTTHARVDLKNAEATIWIELFGNTAIMFRDRLPGAGGLPVGSSEKMLALLSGGIDSPVAAWRMARRGAVVDLIHFHAQPFTDASSVRQATKLAEALMPYLLRANLHLVSLADSQTEILAHARPELRVVLYRRMMMRISAEMARQTGAVALITGDSLGQVASQTVENLRTVEASVPTTQVLRPLVAMDKQEIIDQAKRIGTFDLSTRPYQDSCALFEARSPATHASERDAEMAEVGIDTDALVKAALEGAETVTLELAPPPRP